MLLENPIALITNLGFPIFLSLFLLFRMEKALNNNTFALNELRLEIAKKK